jgi:ribosomal-protein-alanine N-acetyltransferase
MVIENLITPRMDLIPADAELLQALQDGDESFFRRLGVHTVGDWPPQELADALPSFVARMLIEPGIVGWLDWFLVLREARELVGDCGFKGPPDGEGMVEIGYYVRGCHRRQGYATEAVGTLVGWAMGHGAKGVMAETEPGNIASLGVLSRVGFSAEGKASEEGLVRYRLCA